LENSFISATIVTYNGGKIAQNAVNSIIENTKNYPLEFYVFDNASTDDTLKLLSEIDSVKVKENGKNMGFGAAHNKILETKMGKYHFVINPDIIVNSDVLSAMADFMEQNPDVVMCMPKILNEDGTEQKLPKEKPTFKTLFFGRLSKKIRNEYIWADRDITEVIDVDFCTGCFFCIRSEVFENLGGFDERFFMYLEDADLTQRAKKYGRVVMNPHISVTHIWERESAKKIKYLFIHIFSAIKFLLKKGGM
jgi:GT2 family glycosyltransferase